MNSFEKFWTDVIEKYGKEYGVEYSEMRKSMVRVAYIAGLRRAAEIGKRELGEEHGFATWGQAWRSSCRHYIEAIETEATRLESGGE